MPSTLHCTLKPSTPCHPTRPVSSQENGGLQVRSQQQFLPEMATDDSRCPD